LGHFTFEKITLWSSFVLAHYGISGVLADHPLFAVVALEYHTPYLRVAIQPEIACADRVLVVILVLRGGLERVYEVLLLVVNLFFSCCACQSPVT
jgi:hypothetical protein